MRTRLMIIPALLVGATLAATMGSRGPQEPEYTSDFGLERGAMALTGRLVPDGGNPYFLLRPGTFRRFEGEDDGKEVILETTVLDETRLVTFEVNGHSMHALTRVLEEREWIDGELAEVSHNYYACCPRTGNVFHFGEDVDHYANGKIVSHDGSWVAGHNGAQPGLMMPGLFLLGARYYQEMAPGVAMDRAEHLAMGLNVQTAGGVFQNAVMVLESSDLEDDEETIKIYSENVGLIVDGYLELVAFHQVR